MRVSIFGAFVLLVACGSDTRAASDAGADMRVGVDMGPRADSGPRTDSGARDLGTDEGMGADMAMDAAMDLGGRDMAADASTDLGNADLGMDAAVEMGTDAAVEMGMEAGMCGPVGQPCPAGGCPAGLMCYERVCMPGTLGDCGGIAGRPCGRPLICMVGGSSSGWPCVSAADRDCICAGPAASSFPSVCPGVPPTSP